MIGSIASYGIQQQLHSSPSNTPAPSNSISSHDDGGESNRQTPVPSDNQQTVAATVTSQEGQASRQQSEKGLEKKPETTNSPIELSEEEVKHVQELKQRDIEVRAHEAAHLAAAGRYAQGGIKLTLTRGPDGRSYAIGGSVGIDTSREATPEATIRKADQIRRAALAPAEPSGQDRSVAAEATQMKLAAQSELAKEKFADSDVKADENPIESADTTQNSVTPDASNPDTSNKEDSTSGSISSPELKSEASPTCAVCGGGHPTGPHLQSNQRKTDQYTAPIQGQEPQLNRVA